MTDAVFYLAETITIRGIIRDYEKQPIPLTGALIRIRIGRTDTKRNIFELVATVTDAARGLYQRDITPLEQKEAGLRPGDYDYEVRVDLPDGVVSTQNTGQITINPSRF